MTTRNIIISFFSFVIITVFVVIIESYWPLKRSKNGYTEFARNFQQGEIYFEAIKQRVEIGNNNYFRDDGVVKDIDDHCRKIRREIIRLNLLPIEEIEKIRPEPRDFVDGFCLTIHSQGRKFIIIFYIGEGKSQADILAEKVHEESHALIRFGKIDLIKSFLESKGISVKYDISELYRLCGLDPSKKSLLKKFNKAIRNKNAAMGELLAQKIGKYHAKLRPEHANK
jgi:hypothetical protein